MSLEYPDNLRYTDTHEYVKLVGDIAKIGISAFAVDQLGDIVFVELPAVGDKIEQGQRFGTIESVKAVEDLKAPIDGEVIKCNQGAVDAPEIVSENPYTDGWLIEVKVTKDNAALLSAADYRSQIGD